MTWENFADGAAAVCLLLGAFLTFAAGVGVLRFPDLFARMHAATKPQVLGLLLMLSAEALRVRSWSVVGLLFLVVVFQLLTAPVAAHMVGRAGMRTHQIDNDFLTVNELAEDQEHARREARAVESKGLQVSDDVAVQLESRLRALRKAQAQDSSLRQDD
ncbi:monovalent cation/H(+) antiporter subunit G [Timonella sp. A28]|uniref:monovalent cation/H(+) antiporter subunit G n=1 Tax=Timonella sp. A28 TaxID=3442640 RepID=UPI003EBD2FF0